MLSESRWVRGATRRDLLLSGTTLVAVSAIAGCDALSTEPEGSGKSEEKVDTEAKEAPALADRVKSGELPRLADRIPKKPLTIEPVDQLGQYGGTWNNAIAGPSDSGHLARTIEYDNLVAWDREWTKAEPNIAESFEVSADGTQFTFVLREGMKWSDGKAFTADDILFAFENVMYNPELFPTGAPSRYNNEDGTPATVEKLGDYEVRITFVEPHGLFIDELATPSGREPTIFPRHYLEQFHKDYGTDVEAMAQEEGYDGWADLFLAKADFRETAEVPTLYGWYLTTPVGESTRVVADRNPYYWKVDPEGRQLPYLDQVTFEVIDDVETILLKATNGEFEFHTRHFNDLKNKPVVARHREEADYEFISMLPSTNNEMVIMLNLTHKDSALREIFQNKDFRIGLSHAINRQEIIDAVFQRQGVVSQPTPRPDSEFYDEEFSLQYTEYDVDKANEHLDLAGFVERDGDGFRLRSDGKRISFSVEVPTPTLKSTWVPTMELIREYWKAVGVDVQTKGEDRSLWTERIIANDHDATVWLGEGGLQDAILYGFYYIPNHAGARYAIPWSDWYLTRGELGEEPPADVRAQLDIYDQLRQAMDKEEQSTLFTEIIQIAKEQFYNIGIVQLEEEYGIVANNFHNVPKTMPFAYLYPTPAPTRPEQYFISE